MGVLVDWPGEVISPLVAVASIGGNSGRVVVEEGLKGTCCWEQCGLAEEAVVWCCVYQHAAVKGVDLHLTEPTNCAMARAYLDSEIYPRTIDHGRSIDNLAGR
jgi:hypothetical protein